MKENTQEVPKTLPILIIVLVLTACLVGLSYFAAKMSDYFYSDTIASTAEISTENGQTTLTIPDQDWSGEAPWRCYIRAGTTYVPEDDFLAFIELGFGQEFVDYKTSFAGTERTLGSLSFTISQFCDSVIVSDGETSYNTGFVIRDHKRTTYIPLNGTLSALGVIERRQSGTTAYIFPDEPILADPDTEYEITFFDGDEFPDCPMTHFSYIDENGKEVIVPIRFSSTETRSND